MGQGKALFTQTHTLFPICKWSIQNQFEAFNRA